MGLGRQDFSGKRLAPPEADAVVAYSGLLNVAEIGHMMLIGAASGDGLKLGNLDEMRQATRGLMMGLDPIDDILSAMGPDVGFFVSRTRPRR